MEWPESSGSFASRELPTEQSQARAPCMGRYLPSADPVTDCTVSVGRVSSVAGSDGDGDSDSGSDRGDLDHSGNHEAFQRMAERRELSRSNMRLGISISPTHANDGPQLTVERARVA